MLMIVFGAGASYDSVPSKPPNFFPRRTLPTRPPLADELFDEDLIFLGELHHFPQCQAVIPYLQILKPDKSVEAVLEQLRDEAVAYRARHQQLAAIRFYLHFMLTQCERKWQDNVVKGISNYKTLLDQAEQWRRGNGRVCIVIFNYDTLIEKALSSVGISISQIADYISHPAYQLVKLHGSVNWGRKVKFPSAVLGSNEWQVVTRLIEGSSDLPLTDDFSVISEVPIAVHEQDVFLPALAIPVETKKSYECPADHLSMLNDLIPQVTKLLLIGWRGAETHFLTMLKERLPKKIPIYVVAGSAQSASQVIDNLKASGITGHFMQSDGGFTKFILDREAESFFRA